MTISAPSQTVESQSFGMSNLGNTSGTTGIASGGQVRFLFAGGNNVTLSQSLNGASGRSRSRNAQTGISGIANADDLHVRNRYLSDSARSRSVQRRERTSSACNADVSFGVGIATPTRRIRRGRFGVGGASRCRRTRGSVSTVSVAAQTGTQFSLGLSNIGNTAGDTVTVGGRVILAGGNDITLSGSSNGVSQTITVSARSRSPSRASRSALRTSATRSAPAVSRPGARCGPSSSARSNITVSQSVNGASATLSLIGQPSFSAGLSNVGNTSGDTGITGTRLVLAGGNNITLSELVERFGGDGHDQRPRTSVLGPCAVGVSTGGNTAGSTGITGTRLVLVGTNNISLSQSTDANGGTVSFNNTVSRVPGRCLNTAATPPATPE